MTLDLIIKFRVDPSSRNCFLTSLSKIVTHRYKNIFLASRKHQTWILRVFVYRTNPNDWIWTDSNHLSTFFDFSTFCWLLDIV